MGAHRRALQEASRLKLSIVVPAFNEERLLARTLAAIRAAAGVFDAEGWEIVVCDNNSTDRTAEIARAAGAKVVFEPHNQISRARNRGASTAAGEWLVFVDADSTPSRELFVDLKAAIGSGRVLGGGSTLAADEDVLPVRAAGGFSEELYASGELELSGRLKRLAREQGREFRILHRHPLRTSARKLHLYGWWELSVAFGRFLLSPRRMLRSAKACSPWYDGRR